MSDPRDSDVLFNIGVIKLDKFDDKQSAFEQFEKALSFDPDHLLALFNSAVLLQESGDAKYRSTAEERLKRVLAVKENKDRKKSVLSSDPPDEKIYFNLGMLAMDAKNDVEAEALFRKAIEIKPDFRSALFNLALMLTSSAEARVSKSAVVGRGGAATSAADASKTAFEPAVKASADLLEHHPNHVKGLILMGDLQINRIKNLTHAEFCFSRAFELDSKNDQALHNLCVVYVERGELERAKECLERVLRMVPGETYVRRHLEIVMSRITKRKKMTGA